jgi:Fe-S oxidoreductase
MSTTAHRAIKTLIEQTDAPIASYFTSCVHCGMCADACLFYTETQDPKYTPIYKVKPFRKVWHQEYTFMGKLMKTLGLAKPVTDEELAEWEELVYDSCTLCGRCSLVCPMGNDITYMIRHFREGMAASGHAPEGLKQVTRRTIEIGSPMGITPDTLRKQAHNAEQEAGLPVPLDVAGADYLLLLSANETMVFTDTLPAITRIFHHAGISWTLSSDAYEATNAGIQIGSSDLAAQLVNRIVTAAEKLKVKYVISPECGHAYTALRWEGPNLIGKPYPFEVVHIVELLDELRASGRLELDGKEDSRLTFHDPCQMVRRGGVVEQPRRLLDMVASDFVEMPDAGIQNWCCGGGGGVSANERAQPLRLKVFSRKKAQLDGLQVETLVTSCANCRDMLEDGLANNNMDNIEVIGLSELLANNLKTKDSTKSPGDES